MIASMLIGAAATFFFYRWVAVSFKCDDLEEENSRIRERMKGMRADYEEERGEIFRHCNVDKNTASSIIRRVQLGIRK